MDFVIVTLLVKQQFLEDAELSDNYRVAISGKGNKEHAYDGIRVFNRKEVQEKGVFW